MKKYIFAVTLLLLPLVANATVFINGGSRTSPTTSFVQLMSTNTNDRSSVRLTQDCSSAVDLARSTADSIALVTVDQAFSLQRSSGRSCTDIADATVLLATESYMKICRATGSTASLTDTNVTLGRASVQPVHEFVDDLNTNNNLSVVGIPMRGSGDVVTALVNGDVDLGVIAASTAATAEQSGRIECMYDTLPYERSEQSINRFYNLSIDGFLMHALLITFSNTPDQLITAVNATVSSAEFAGYLQQSGYVVINKSTALAAWLNNVTIMLETYVNK